MEQKRLSTGREMAKHIIVYCMSEDSRWEKLMSVWVMEEVCAKRSEWEGMHTVLDNTQHSYASLSKWKHILSMVFYGQVWAVLPKVLDNDQFIFSESDDMKRLVAC